MWSRSLVVLLLSSSFGYAQVATIQQGPSRAFETFGNDSVPDPNDKLSVALLATNASVQKELGMHPSQVAALNNQLKANGGSFSSVSSTSNGKSPFSMSREEIEAYFHGERANRQLILDEIFSPEQWTRLSEICFQVEISRVGLFEAVWHGRLGREIGVYDNQIDRLERKAKQIKENCLSQLAMVLSSAQEKTLSAINPKDRLTISDAIGEPFWFIEEIPNPRFSNMPLQRFVTAKLPQENWRLVFNRSVQTELGLFANSEELRRLRFMNHSYATSTQLHEALDTLLTDNQRERWQQLMYQIEIHRHGFSEAMTSGSLSSVVQLPKEDLIALERIQAEVDKEKAAAVVGILQAAQDAFLAELTPDQRKAARRLIGSPFLFKEEAFGESVPR